MMVVGLSITSLQYGLCDKTKDARTRRTAQVAKVMTKMSCAPEIAVSRGGNLSRFERNS
jgi:hypothetical protein